MHDIFISYKDEGDGRLYAQELWRNLESLGFSVYFNENERRSGQFPERIRIAIENCKDLILIVSNACLEQLHKNNDVDWIRTELVIAHKNKKNIVPVFLNGITMPKHEDYFPEDLSFLCTLDGIPLGYNYMTPLVNTFIHEYLSSKPEKNDIYRNTDNSNENYNVHNDFTDTLQKALAGDAKAQYEAGIMYYFGFSSPDNTTDVNYPEAAKWFKKAAKSDTDYAYHSCTMLAKMYFSGLVPLEGHSFEKCLKYYEKAKDFDEYAKSKYCLMTLQGLGCKFDYAKLDEFAEQCFQQKMDSRLVCEIANIYASYGMFEQAVKLYESMETVNSAIEYQKGLLYKKGVFSSHSNDSINPDYEKAKIHFRTASELGHLQATYELANLYFNPINNKTPNFSEAKKYFKKAADKGHSESQYKLGWIYEYGLDESEVDIESAIHYYEEAAKNGHELAALQLAQLYQQSKTKNFHKAFYYAKMSAETDCDIAQFILGNLYFFGRGCKPDISKAYKWYTKAAENGIFQANIMIEKILSVLEEQQ